jgi:hypothetical protein
LNLKSNPKYQNFKDLFFNISTSSGSLDLIWEAKKKYEEIQLRDISGVTADKIVVIWISYGRAKGSLDVNIYTPSELNYLTQDTEFFDFIFDALNEITLDPNKNSDEGKKLAKLESVKRKEAQKGEEEKIVKSTEYPKEVKDFNPRHLYRFKTAEELELQYNSNDWKLISNRLLNCDWLKKVTNRKILGLKVPKDGIGEAMGFDTEFFNKHPDGSGQREYRVKLKFSVITDAGVGGSSTITIGKPDIWDQNDGAFHMWTAGIEPEIDYSNDHTDRTDIYTFVVDNFRVTPITITLNKTVWIENRLRKFYFGISMKGWFPVPDTANYKLYDYVELFLEEVTSGQSQND